MPAVNLKKMSVDELLSLRSEVDGQLAQKQRELRDALRKLESKLDSAEPRSVGKTSPLKGGKVAPKYRSPEGETWAGRGARPRWLAGLLKQGRKLDEFLIDRSRKTAGPGKSSAAKKSRKRKAA
jgi:DNA-binding protein H-NS